MAGYYPPHKIRVNVIAPGLVRTPVLEWPETDPELSPFLKKETAMTDGMFAAGEVARAALFLLSPESRAITGEVFHAGWRMAGVREQASMVVMGIDIGGAQIKAGMVDEKGAILASRTIPTPPDLETFVPSLHGAIQWLLGATAPPAGVGVGCKGIINPDGTQVEMLPGVLHYLQGQQLSELVGLPPNLPVFADNDARVAMAGEMVWGAARGHRDVVMLTLGTGVGGAVVTNGELLRGHRGIAGHLGHLTVDPDGPDCSCGNRGCLETVFSARAIEGEAWAAVHRGCSSTLTRLFREQPQLATCRTIFQAAREGDELAGSIVSRAIRKLGAAVAGLLHVFDPELLILGGQVADAGADLLLPLQEEVWSRSRGLLGREVPIIEQQVADKSGIVGAAGLVMAHAPDSD